MIDKESFINFLNNRFLGKEIKVQHFDSGCSMIDVYIDEKDALCIQIEPPSQIGISIIEDYKNYMDLSTFADHVFHSNKEAEDFILQLE